MRKVVGTLLIVAFALAVASYAELYIGVDPVADVNSLALRYDFAGGIIGKVGINYSNANAGGVSTSTTGYGIELDYALPAKLGSAKPLIGLDYNSDGAATATTNIVLKLGLEIEPVPGVLLSGGITPYTSTSVGGGAATTNLTTGGAWIAFYSKLI